jgi:RNA polymerase sigma factor (sigma-70 family)
MKLDLLSDEELMVKYQGGDEVAFELLYLRHSGKIYGFLKSKIRSVEKVDDIYQNVFVKIHKSKKLYQKSFLVLPWFFTITKSVMIDYIRAEKKSKLRDDIDIDQLAYVEGVEIKTEIDTIQLIQDLSDTQKQALQMRYVDDKSFEEIATHLETSAVNVRQLISRGIKRLKELVESKENI